MRTGVLRWCLLLLLGALACSAGEGEPKPEARPLDPATLPPIRVDAGEGAPAMRAAAEGCDPVEESLRYAEFVGSRALATLSWTGASDDLAALEIPLYVVAIEDGSIQVRLLKFPLREQYMHLWLGSGHLRAGPEDRFLLEPCSAKLAPWPDGPDSSGDSSDPEPAG